MHDLSFWLVTIIAAAALVGLWFVGSKSLAQGLDLEVADDELRAAHATIDRLTREVQDRPMRGAGGRFASTRRGVPAGG